VSVASMGAIHEGCVVFRSRALASAGSPSSGFQSGMKSSSPKIAAVG